MAEQSQREPEPPQGETGQPDQQGISASGAAAALLMAVQSKCKDVELVEFKEVESPGEGKNKLFLVCDHCKCKVMRPGFARLVEKEIFMPHMVEKYQIGTEPAGNTPTKFWLVEDMFHFENVGFSKTVGETVKYLICADCEIGPIGWHDVRNQKEFYVAAERVKYATA